MRDFTINPYRLSDSALNTLLLCERRFQLDRMLRNTERDAFQLTVSPEMVRGTAYGVGIQTYMYTGNMDQAVYDAWLAYFPHVEDPPKTFEGRTLNNLLRSQEAMDKLRKQYRVAIFHDKPALELSFRLNIDAKWYYVGYIDLVLQRISDGQYGILEVKTTSFNIRDLRPMYYHSGQALGYSIILDQIAGAEQTSFQTPYFVCQDMPKDFIPQIHVFDFKRTLLDRLKWFITLGMDVERLNKMEELGIFPQRQKGCISFGRVCPHFGFCGLTAGEKPREQSVDKNEYQFTYQLQDVISDHIRRVEHA